MEEGGGGPSSPEAKVIHLLCDILAESGGGWDLPEGVNHCRVLKKTEEADSLQIHLHTWFSTESLILGLYLKNHSAGQLQVSYPCKEYFPFMLAAAPTSFCSR